MRHFLRACFLVFIAGCQAPLAQLTFPYRPLVAPRGDVFDVDLDGREEFALTFDDAGRV